uniref:ACB domain-containing protein n=1 Tax=Polytomella parva TaxID=51329 RepID=A0A6U0U134_9CHLO|mmetsp:Transcript_13385/g.23712  ORF Transcript_13385/g.23712 Transcript_13385/m.23712 type:complete len:387 (+) Transcript_13385:118-1278(+)|eukprot:CAMPEP_0175072828 /NCGR_PEP_ID=MMETSP0052_2-20121109/20156_1 /TAXON_ID=51329 ORGANISM="Polytomella parva, Strain SAG 63-3" /NCGR_SAMPLE_ID=MMETSP0052_2 /ASSEMBLY_ACC=CAM_ASM_000194 /LENGTH=386 /DNA_ID=CAMNT_0016340435 /DNA_START=11 /DNA_END=1171 /DNA_ORIENTATION=-
MSAKQEYHKKKILVKQFKAAAEFLASCVLGRDARINDEKKLKLYGFFKQASDGPCTKGKPPFWDYQGSAKWKAWSALASMSQDDAMAQYISVVLALAPEFKSTLDRIALRTASAAANEDNDADDDDADDEEEDMDLAHLSDDEEKEWQEAEEKGRAMREALAAREKTRGVPEEGDLGTTGGGDDAERDDKKGIENEGDAKMEEMGAMGAENGSKKGKAGGRSFGSVFSRPEVPDSNSKPAAIPSVVSDLLEANRLALFTLDAADNKSIHELSGEGDAMEVANALSAAVTANLSSETAPPESARDEEGRTALHFAADRGHIDVAKVLLSYGADVNAQDVDGSTPLHYAALCQHQEMYNFLLNEGKADPNIEDVDGVSPENVAKENGW